MTKPSRIPVERDDRQQIALVEELRRLVDEGLASGIEPYEGVEAIKAELQKRHKKR